MRHRKASEGLWFCLLGFGAESLVLRKSAMKQGHVYMSLDGDMQKICRYMYIYIDVCIHLCTHVCVYIHVHIYRDVYRYECVHVYRCLCVYMYVYI